MRDLQHIDRLFALVLTTWATAVAIAGYFGFFASLPTPTLPIWVAAGIIIPLTVYYRSAAFRDYVESIPLKHLTLFHLWRIPAGFAFLYAGSLNLLPETFVRNAGYGDLAVGFLVPLVMIVSAGRWKYVAFHIFGMIDFVLAVGTGLTFSLLSVPLMENIATFPLVMIPLFGVCVTGSLSIMTLDRLLVARRSPAVIHVGDQRGTI